MGILGGLQVVRATSRKSFISPDMYKYFPNIFSTTNVNFEKSDSFKISKNENEFVHMKIIMTNKWKKKVDFNAKLYVGVLVFLMATTYLIDSHPSFNSTINTKGIY